MSLSRCQSIYLLQFLADEDELIFINLFLRLWKTSSSVVSHAANGIVVKAWHSLKKHDATMVLPCSSQENVDWVQISWEIPVNSRAAIPSALSWGKRQTISILNDCNIKFSTPIILMMCRNYSSTFFYLC